MANDKRNPEEDFTALSGFVEWLGLEGEEIESFITEAMTRRGHKAVTKTEWHPADNEGGDQKSSNVLGLNRGGQKKASGGSNWQYSG